MLTKRIVPCLDIDAGRVVKGTRFRNLRDIGDPVELAERYEAARVVGRQCVVLAVDARRNATGRTSSCWEVVTALLNSVISAATEPIPRQCGSLLVAAGTLCRTAGVHPARIVASDLAALRARYAERVDRAAGSHP